MALHPALIVFLVPFGGAGEVGWSDDAVRCTGHRSVLHRPSQHAAKAHAARYLQCLYPPPASPLLLAGAAETYSTGKSTPLFVIPFADEFGLLWLSLQMVMPLSIYTCNGSYEE